jgi:hypothetical protein
MVLPHAFGERPMLKRMFAAARRAREKCRKLNVTNFERGHLRRLREESNDNFRRRHAPAATPTPSAFLSKTRTCPMKLAALKNDVAYAEALKRTA